MRVVFFGTPSFVIPIIKSLAKHFNIIGVVTAPDAPIGRKKTLTPFPVKQFALEKLPNATIITPQQFNNLTIKQLHNLNPDLFIVAAYGKIIPKQILDIPRLGAINIHPSLLPKYRGPSPVQTAIINGDKETGITFIKMDEEMDHGPMIAQKVVSLTGNEIAEALHHQLFQLAAELLPTTIQQFNNLTIKTQPQDETKATYCKKIVKEDGYFNIDNPPSPEILDRMIRAYYPWPTAYTKLKIKNEKLKIIKFLPDKKIQPEGGKRMTYKEFLNGYPELKEKIEKLNIF